MSLPPIDEDEAVACTEGDAAETESQPQATLAQMRTVLGRCGALLDALPTDAAGAVLARVDRPLIVSQVSKGWRAAVLGATPRAPLRYVLDRAKYHASTSAAQYRYSTSKNGEMLGDLSVKCGKFDVVSIAISGLHASFTDASGLAALLPRCPHLSSLDLSGNNLRLDTLRGLEECTALTTLDLSSVRDVCQNTSSLLSLCPPVLRELRLRDVGLRHDIDMAGLVVGLRACTGLTHLDLSENQFCQCPALPRILAQLPALERLELSGTGMRQVAVRDAARSLQACTRLTHLDLSDLWCQDHRLETTIAANVIQELSDAGEEFMQMLPSWPALTFLDLGDMWLGTDATHFAASLLALPRLAHLNVARGRLGTPEMTNITAALPRMPALAELNMSGNGIDEVGGQALVRVLPHCTALRTLRLTGNPLTSAGVQGLAAALQECPKLTELDLLRTQLESATIMEIENAWEAQHEPRGDFSFTRRRGGVDCLATHDA